MPLGERQTVLSWWMELAKVLECRHLAELAITVHSALPTSMPDERTASTLAEINSPKSSRQLPSTIVHTAQIRQWQRYHGGIEDFQTPSPIRINFHTIDYDLYNSRSSARDIKTLLNTVDSEGLEGISFVGENTDTTHWLSESREESTRRFIQQLTDLDCAGPDDVADWARRGSNEDTSGLNPNATTTAPIEDLIDFSSSNLAEILPDLRDSAVLPRNSQTTSSSATKSRSKAAVLEANDTTWSVADYIADLDSD